MKIGDIKKVENKLGIFTIKLIEIINKDIGTLDGALGEFKKLRIPGKSPLLETILWSLFLLFRIL